TAPSFGFGSADNYYATQSAERFIGRIRTPALLVQAKDDPLVPFEIYRHPAFSENPHLHLIAPDRGGHLGYISKRKPRLWLDGVLLEWLQLTSAGQSQVCYHGRWHDNMIRTQISLDKREYDLAKKEARSMGIPVAEFVRR